MIVRRETHLEYIHAKQQTSALQQLRCAGTNGRTKSHTPERVGERRQCQPVLTVLRERLHVRRLLMCSRALSGRYPPLRAASDPREWTEGALLGPPAAPNARPRRTATRRRGEALQVVGENKQCQKSQGEKNEEHDRLPSEVVCQESLSEVARPLRVPSFGQTRATVTVAR